MFGRKKPSDDAGLERLQQEIARDKLRMSERFADSSDDDAADDDTSARAAVSGRIYQVFAVMKEA